MKLKYDIPVSEFAFKFNLRRYTKVSFNLVAKLRTQLVESKARVTSTSEAAAAVGAEIDVLRQELAAVKSVSQAGAYTRPLLSST